MLRHFLLALFLLWSGAAAARPPTILVWGDSLGASYGVPEEQGWVTLLEQRLRTQGYDYTVVNGSVSGETTAGGLARLPYVLDSNKPVIVILELGSNDGLRGTPIKVMKHNLGGMIALSRKQGAEVLLLGMLMPPNYGPVYTKDFRQVYEDLARQYKAPLLPFFLKGVADHEELMQADDMHPTAEAQPMLLDSVWPLLQPLLKKPAT